MYEIKEGVEAKTIFSPVIKEIKIYKVGTNTFYNKEDAEFFVKRAHKQNAYGELVRVELADDDWRLIKNSDDWKRFSDYIKEINTKYNKPDKYPFLVTYEYYDGGDYDKDDRFFNYITEDDLKKVKDLFDK